MFLWQLCVQWWKGVTLMRLLFDQHEKCALTTLLDCSLAEVLIS